MRALRRRGNPPPPTIRNQGPPVPLGGTARAGSIWSSGRNDQPEMDLYGSVGSLYGIVSRLANSTSKAEWFLWRRRSRNPDKGARTLVERHAALEVWDHPNPFMPGQELRERTQQHLDITGEGIWVLAYTDGVSFPVEMWPCRPDRIAPVPSTTEYLVGWVYFGPAGERIPLGLNEVIQLQYPNPSTTYRGLGPVQAVQIEAETRSAASEWNRRFFLNGALPGGYVKFPKRLSQPEFEEWQQRWRETHQGVQAAHRVGMLENAEWVDTGSTQRDMQFEQLMRMTGDLMREPFGIHKASLGLSDDVNRANAEAAQWLLASELLVPRLDRMKGKLNEQFLPLFDPDPMLEFDYEDPRQDSQEQELASLAARVQAAMEMVDRGADWDEALAAFDLPPIPRDEVPMPAPAAAPMPEGDDMSMAAAATR